MLGIFIDTLFHGTATEFVSIHIQPAEQTEKF